MELFNVAPKAGKTLKLVQFLPHNLRLSSKAPENVQTSFVHFITAYYFCHRMKVLCTLLLFAGFFTLTAFHSANQKANQHSLAKSFHATDIPKLTTISNESSNALTGDDLIFDGDDDDDFTVVRKKVQLVRSFFNLFDDFVASPVLISINKYSAKHELYCVPPSEKCVLLRALRI